MTSLVIRWLEIDNQWIVDYANGISGLDGIPRVVFDATDDSDEMSAISRSSIGESGTFGASFGTLEIFEDEKYMQSVGEILGIDMDSEVSEIDRIRDVVEEHPCHDRLGLL